MTDVIDILETRAIFNAGQFDTDFRYIRTVSSGALTTMLAGPSIAPVLNQTYDRISFRYECGSYVIVAASNLVTPPSDVVNIANGIAL